VSDRPKSYGIIGSRTAFTTDDYASLQVFMQDKEPAKIVSGGARGADAAARCYAQSNGIPLVEHLPDYKQHGKRAPLVRNELIVRDADEVVAIWDGQSTGTAYTIGLARKAGKPVHIIKAKETA